MLDGQGLVELRGRLLDGGTTLAERDAVWRQLVDRHRRLRGQWTVAAVAMAMPGLMWHARQLGAGWRDVEDLHAELVVGFLRELDRIDVGKPRIVRRLVWAARRAGVRLCTAEQPVPVGDRIEVVAAVEGGEPSVRLRRLLVDARDRRVITSADVELIAVTRLGRATMRQVAAQWQVAPEVVRARRSRAERRLAAAVRAGRLP
jgi:hypothetical protein